MARYAIHPLLDLERTPALLAGLEAVFFESSNTKSFANSEARSTFRERWLGRYLTHDAGYFYVATAADGTVAGYLAGCLDDPARTERFLDIPYFPHFADLTLRYPAHLHINLRPGARNTGTGSALIARFAADASEAGAPGVHVVTSRGARNASFYQRNGFVEAGALGEGEREIVFLARTLRLSA